MQWFKNKYLKLKSSSNATRATGLWLLSAGGLLTGMLATSPAWSLNRTYPLVPVIEGWSLSAGAQTFIFSASLACLVVAIFFTRRPRILTTLAVLGVLTLVLLDITRLQPWVLHYLAILLLFSFFIPTRYSLWTFVLDAARIIIAGIYFWSGLQKLNVRFFDTIFPWFTESLWQPFGQIGAVTAVSIGLLVPFIEMAFAVGLFSRRFRKISILGATTMLFIVLLSIGPLGHGWNSSVWFWNIVIYGSVCFLFVGQTFSLKEFGQRFKINKVAWVAFLAFWIVPLGNLVGLSDHYVSWSLYSGKVPEATLMGEQKFLEKLSPTAQNGELNYARWTINELNLVPYPETRVFRSVFNQICLQYPDQPLTLQIDNFTGDYHNVNQQEFYECNKEAS